MSVFQKCEQNYLGVMGFHVRILLSNGSEYHQKNLKTDTQRDKANVVECQQLGNLDEQYLELLFS